MHEALGGGGGGVAHRRMAAAKFQPPRLEFRLRGISLLSHFPSIQPREGVNGYGGSVYYVALCPEAFPLTF